MNMRNLCRHVLHALLAAGACASALAADVATDPIGYVTLQIAPGTGTVRKLNLLSCPLLVTASGVTGATAGAISSLTANSITVDTANWAAGELSQLTSPKVVRITSGAAAGRTFLISRATTNTATTLTLDSTETSGTGLDLTALGIVTGAGGDTFTIFDCDTLSSLFGDPATSGFLGNNSPDLGDNVLLLINGAWNTFYFHTTNNRWTKKTLGSPDATNQAVKPESGLVFSRLGSTALSFTITGTVPMTNRSDVVRKSGLTLLGSNWPIDMTLLASHIQDIPNWQANASVSGADQVLVLVNGAWNTFWWTGTNWKKKTLGSPIADTQVIPAGSGFVLSKLSAAANDGLLTQQRPY